MKKILLFICLFMISINVYAVDKNSKVYDYASLFSEVEEDKLRSSMNDYSKSSGFDSVIVTTKSLGEYNNIEDYASSFYKSNGFKSDGVVFVIYVGDNEPSIYMSGFSSKTDKVYTDARVRQILEYIYKDISIGNYYKAMSDYVKILQGYYNIDNNSNYSIDSNGHIVKNIPIGSIIIISIAISFISFMWFYTKTNTHRVRLQDVMDGRIDKNSLVIRKM